MSRWKTAVIVLCCIVVAGSTAIAQTTGAVRGVVTDDTGAVLPGATVVLTGENLMGDRTMVTNEVGVFRFPSLSPGTYAVEVSMQGFDTVRLENLDVRLNTTANAPVTLKIATLTEAITVVGESPVVDVTKSGVSTSFKNEMLEELPTQRNMYDLMQISPGMTVDVGDGQSDRVVAFGSNRQSNSWNIDGVNVSAPETGSSWWEVNPDNIEEVEVLGVGAPAEYGNHLGAVLNVVTKKGGNSFHGGGSFFWQTSSLTDTSATVDDIGFNRKKFHNATFQLGGPFAQDKVWFFGSFEYLRDASTEPGNDPSLAPTNYSDMYDLKVTARLGDRHELSGFIHHNDWGGLDSPSPVYAQSALSGERGINPAWGAGITSTLSDRFLLEFNYAGWWSDDIHDSQTGSFETPFIDYTPPDGGPATYSGGVWWPWDYVTWKQQIKGKATYYTENFLNAQHEFKFGVQYSRGSAKTNVAPGPNGAYEYHYAGYFYRNYQAPYQYGGESTDLGFFVDDSITVNDKLTINLGIRFDHNTGDFPDYERLVVGEPSISPSINAIGTGETVPGLKGLINWNLISPRVGFAWQPTGDGRSVLRASFGVYYDQNVIGNWDAPPPGLPTFTGQILNPDTGEFETLYEITSEDVGFNPNLLAPRTLQYAIGFEQQVSNEVALGIQYVYKDTKDLVGWEILGGSYEDFPFTDPFLGTEYTMLSAIELPVIRKGNRPGTFPGGEDLEYFQKYHGVALTFNKRFSQNWSMGGSYTWSRSEGRIPRMLTQTQFNPFYGSSGGSDPNQWLNTESLLQGDRPHMFRVQGVYRFPYEIQLAASAEFSSGRAHSRQIRVGGLAQGGVDVIMEPIGAYRYSPIKNIDLSIGKRFYISDQAYFRLEGWIFNLLNSDQELFFSTLRLQSVGDEFTPDTWMKPRRLQIRAGFYF